MGGLFRFYIKTLFKYYNSDNNDKKIREKI